MGFSSVLVIKGCRLWSATVSHNSHREHTNNFLEVTHTRVFMVRCLMDSLWSKLGFIGKLTIGPTCTPLNLFLLIMEIRDGKYPLSHLVLSPPGWNGCLWFGGSAQSSLNGNVSWDVKALGSIIFFFPLKFRGGKYKAEKSFLSSLWVGGSEGMVGKCVPGVGFLGAVPLVPPFHYLSPTQTKAALSPTCFSLRLDGMI